MQLYFEILTAQLGQNSMISMENAVVLKIEYAVYKQWVKYMTGEGLDSIPDI